MKNRLGFINGGQGSYQIFPDQPKMVRIPDVSFIRNGRLEGGKRPRGHCRIVPDLVVDVISPNDKTGEISQKIKDFQSAGVPLIWVVYPDTPMVQVYRLDGSIKLLQPGVILEVEDVLPGFQCQVSDIFA